jgi:hypothetical protein
VLTMSSLEPKWPAMCSQGFSVPPEVKYLKQLRKNEITSMGTRVLGMLHNHSISSHLPPSPDFP